MTFYSSWYSKRDSSSGRGSAQSEELHPKIWIVDITLKKPFLGLSLDENSVGTISEIKKGSPIAKDGRIEVGDTILKIDDTMLTRTDNNAQKLQMIQESLSDGRYPRRTQLVVAKCNQQQPPDYCDPSILSSPVTQPISMRAWVEQQAAHTFALIKAMPVDPKPLGAEPVSTQFPPSFDYQFQPIFENQFGPFLETTFGPSFETQSGPSSYTNFRSSFSSLFRPTPKPRQPKEEPIYENVPTLLERIANEHQALRMEQTSRATTAPDSDVKPRQGIRQKLRQLLARFGLR